MKKEKESRAEIMIEEFLRLDKTQEFVKQFRELFGIPIHGFPITQEHIKDIESQIVLDFYTPKVNLKPTDPDILEQIKNGKSVGISLWRYCMGHVNKYFLVNNRRASIYLCLYIFFNKVPLCAKMKFKSENDFIDIINIPNVIEEYDFDETHEELIGWLEYLSSNKPIAILVDPHISLNTFKELISLKWPVIEKHRDTQKMKKYSSRTKPAQEVNDIVYENINLPLAKIRRKLASNKIFLDDGHISSIKNIQKKKRKLTDIG